MKSLAIYTLARLGLFVGFFTAIWLIAGFFLPWTTTNVMWTAIIALMASSFASFSLLRRLRDDLASSVKSRSDQMSDRLDRARSKEDSDDVD